MMFALSTIKKFQEKIFDWWHTNQRDLPWRDTDNPYHIMVSEFMLQQTQVSRVIEKYHDFIRKYPDIEDLAKASKGEVIQLWQGLGYNRRAVWLYEAAEKITNMDDFPKTDDKLIKLKGIGPYTSKAIPIFAFNANYATIDSNIRRVLINEGFATENTSKKELQIIAEQLLPLNQSRDWHNALMDYGSMVATSSSTGIKPQTSQPRFEGSNRQIRGQLLKEIAKEQPISQTELSKIFPNKNLKQVLLELENDGLITSKAGEFQLPE